MYVGKKLGLLVFPYTHEVCLVQTACSDAARGNHLHNHHWLTFDPELQRWIQLLVCVCVCGCCRTGRSPTSRTRLWLHVSTWTRPTSTFPPWASLRTSWWLDWLSARRTGITRMCCLLGFFFVKIQVSDCLEVLPKEDKPTVSFKAGFGL